MASELKINDISSKHDSGTVYYSLWCHMDNITHSLIKCEECKYNFLHSSGKNYNYNYIKTPEYIEYILNKKIIDIQEKYLVKQIKQ